MRHSFSRWLAISAALGLLAPAAWFLFQALAGSKAGLESQVAYPLERAVRVLWPSSFWLMATDGIEGTPSAYLFVFLSVAANAALYAILGCVAWSVRYLMVAKKE
jgi:hypothetical protein